MKERLNNEKKHTNSATEKMLTDKFEKQVE